MFYGFVIRPNQLDACVQSGAAFEGYFKSSLFLISQSTARRDRRKTREK